MTGETYESLLVYSSLFAAAFLAATIIPAQSELVLATLLVSGRYDPALLLLVASLGNTLGACVNWLLGRFVERFRDRRWFPVAADKLEKAGGWYLRWGKWSLLLSWLPVIGDSLTVAAGLLRTPFATFFALVLLAKLARYLALAYAVGIFNQP